MLHQVARISVFVALVLVGRCRSEGYYHVDECSNKTACVYSYSSEQESEEGGLNFNTSFTTTVTVNCESVGLLNGEEATEYCMLFQDTVLHYSKPENEASFGSGSGDEDRSKDSLQNVNRLFEEKFCFYQTESGKIPEVYHSETEMADITNIKKSIAAAFQANFKGTEEAVEEDPQSLHLSHYNISNNTDEDTLLMHRKITSEDVLKYSLDSDKEKVELLKDEDVEYRYGVLHHSSGNSTVVIAASHHESEQEEASTGTYFSDSTYDGSKSLISKIKAQASYTLTLHSCSVMPSPTSHRRKRSSSPGQNVAYSSLKAHVNETFEELYQLQKLYGSLGSTSQVLKKLYSNTNDSDTAKKLMLLLSLERKHNPKYRTSALTDVIKFLENLQDGGSSDEVSDLQMRLLLYAVLSSEGSLKAQMALFSSLLWSSDDLESRNIILDIALISEPHPLLVKAIERRIESVRKESDPLVLAYSTLGSKLLPEAKRSIVYFLKQKMLQETDGIEKAHLLHAFGNTGCNDSLAIILPYMDSDDLNVKMAATFALRKHISSPIARKKLKVALEDNEMIETVFEVLIVGTEYISSTVPRRIYIEKKREIEEDMVETLVFAVSSATAVSNSSSAVEDLQSRVCAYLKSSLLSSMEKESLYAQLECHNLAKRGTDWDQRKSDYNIVSSLSDRQSDVEKYIHKAYIWGKKFGVSDLNLKVGAGAFVGFARNVPFEFGFKIFARAIGAIHVLGNSATFFDAKLLAAISGSETRFVAYVTLIGDVLVNENVRVGSRKRNSDCFRREWPVHQRRVRIFRLRFDVFIYVGYLTFAVDAYAQFRVNLRAASCCIENGVEISGALVPIPGVSVQGSATATLAEVVRGGIRITASFDYELEPKMSLELCTKDLRTSRICLTVSHGWPYNRLDMYAFYQIRSVKMCSERVKYPCGVSWDGIEYCYGTLKYPCGFSWGSEHRWDDLSASYDLGSSSLKKLWSSCGSQLSCPSSG